ncbi:MAG: TetR/AcrR family transcriptional regulator [Acidimicrobiales bacterium]
MTTRAEQRETTRRRIVDAAIDAFAENGYDGAGTRDIAARADVTQGLLTYHFAAKVDLWRAAADQLFADLAAHVPPVDPDAGDEGIRSAVRSYVRFSAERPQLCHFMVDAGRSDGDRMRWLVDTHVRPWHAQIAPLADGEEFAPHLHYALVGASSLFFALAPENERLSGRSPMDPEVIGRHADFVARLFVP